MHKKLYKNFKQFQLSKMAETEGKISENEEPQ